MLTERRTKRREVVDPYLEVNKLDEPLFVLEGILSFGSGGSECIYFWLKDLGIKMFRGFFYLYWL